MRVLVAGDRGYVGAVLSPFLRVRRRNSGTSGPSLTDPTGVTVTRSVVTSVKVATLALVALLAVGCSTATSTPKPSPPKPSPSSSSAPASSAGCTTSAAKGGCGPYNNYPHITGITSSTGVGNNVWNPIPGWRQTIYVTDPGNWHVTANMPAGNTAVVSYPSIGANYGQVTDLPTPLTDYSSIYSSFSENMNTTSATNAWAAYDIWTGSASCSPATQKCTSGETMIQNDVSPHANPFCPIVASATFGGSGGVPVHKWNLCKYGSELIWRLSGASEQSGSIDILAMLKWEVTNKYLPAETGLWSVGYGWEICSTGGANENFRVTSFSITPNPSSSASHSPSPS